MLHRAFTSAVIVVSSLESLKLETRIPISLVDREGYIYQLDASDATFTEHTLMTATRAMMGESGDVVPVTLSCVARGEEVVGVIADYTRMIEMSAEPWAPRVVSMFSTFFKEATIECIATELILNTLFTAPLSFPELMKHGLKMLSVTEILHKKYHLNHRSATVHKWGYTADGRFVLANFRGLNPTKSDPKGYHRIREFHQLGLNLRYLLDSNEHFLLLSNEAKWRGRIAFPSDSHPALKQMIEYIFSVSDQEGEMPDRMYPNVRGYLLSMAGDDLIRSSSSRFVGATLLGHGRSGSLLTAIREETGEEVVVKCSSMVHCDLRQEHSIIGQLQAEIWVPRIAEFFELPEVGTECYIMEKLGDSLPGYSKKNGILSLPDLSQVGKRMMAITESLHKTHGLRHGSLHADNWMLRDENDLSSIVLIDFGRGGAGSRADFLNDVKYVIATFRHLRDLSKKMFTCKHLSAKSIDIICPTDELCPEALRRMITTVFALTEFNDDIYSIVNRGLDALVAPDAEIAGIINEIISVIEIHEVNHHAEPVVRSDMILVEGDDDSPREPSVKTTLVSKTFIYQLDSELSDFSGAVLAPALQLSDSIASIEVSLRCIDRDEDEGGMAQDFDNMKKLAHESWVPKVFELFDAPFNGMVLRCISSEFIRETLVSSSSVSRSIEEVMEIGLEILKITEILHRKYRLNHRRSVASAWGYVDDNRFVIANFGGILSLDFDKVGYHRIRELHQLALTLRYLIDSNEGFMDFKRAVSKDPEIICCDGICPPLFKKLVKSTFSVTDEWGELPGSMYTELRAHMLSMARDGIIRTPEFVYTDLHPLGRGESASILSARRGDGETVVLKCGTPFSDDDLVAELEALTKLRAESWAPAIYESFEVPEMNIRCYAMEKLAMSIVVYTREKGAIPIETLTRMGLIMTQTVQSLHQTYGLRHGDIHPDNWMLRDASDPTSLVLIDYGRAYAGTAPLFLRDIREVPITLRFLRDLNPKFFVAKRLKTKDIDIICPRDFCPDTLRNLLAFVLPIEEHDWSIYDRMISIIDSSQAIMP
jgi:hypothetical protein